MSKLTRIITLDAAISFEADVILDRFDALLHKQDQILAGQHRQETTMTQLDTDVAALKAAQADLDGKIDRALAFITSVPGIVKTAVDAATAAGAPPEVLATLEGLAADAQKEATALGAALPAPPPPPPVE